MLLLSYSERGRVGADSDPGDGHLSLCFARASQRVDSPVLVSQYLYELSVFACVRDVEM